MNVQVELTVEQRECWSDVLGTDDLQVIAEDVRYHVVRRGDLEPVHNYCLRVARRLCLPRTMTRERLLRMCCSVWAEQLGLQEWTPREVLIAKSLWRPAPGLWNGAWSPMADPSRPPSPSRLKQQLLQLLRLPVDVEEHVLFETLAEVLHGEEPRPDYDELVGMKLQPRPQRGGARIVGEEDTPAPCIIPQPPPVRRGRRRGTAH